MKPVTDPALLAQLNAPSGLNPVTDPAILAQLNGDDSSPVTFGGSAKAVGTGLAKGAAFLAGIPGDIAKGVDWVSDKIMPPADPEGLAALNKARTGMVSSSAIIDKLNALGLLHQAQNPVEQHLENVASFVPSAIGGPETMAANALKRGVLPGVVSDALGTAAEGTPLETPLRIAGSLVTKGAKPAEIPSSDALLNAGGQGMDAFRASGLSVRPVETQRFASQTLDELAQRGLDQDLAPSTTRTLEKLAGLKQDEPLTAAQLTAARQKLSKIAQQTSDFKPTQDAAAASAALRGFDEHLNRLDPRDVITGDLPSALQLWNDARGNYAAGGRAQTIEKIAQKAIDKAASENSGLNSGNKVRNAFADAVNNSKKTSGMTDAEEAALRKVADGTVLQNTIRSVSNRLGGGGGVGSSITALALGGGLGGTAGAAADGLTGGGIGATIGTLLLANLARRTYNRSVLSSANKMSEMLRQRSPLAASMPTPATSVPPVLQRLLLMHAASQVGR